MDNTRAKRLRVPAKASLYYLTGGVIGKAVSIITTPLFTRLLSEYEYGSYSLYVSWLTVFSVFATLELGGNVMNRCLIERKDSGEGLILSGCYLTFFSSMAFFVLYVLLSPFVMEATGLSVGIFCVMSLQMLFDGVISVILSGERFFYGYKTVFLVNTLSSVISPVLAIIFIRLFSPQAKMRIAATLAVSGAAALFLFLRSVKKGGARGFSLSKAKSDVKRLLGLCLPLLPYYLCRTAIGVTDKLLITNSYGKGALAKYSVASSLGLAPTFLVSAIGYAVSPWIMRKLKLGEGEKCKRVAGAAVISLYSVGLIINILSPELLSILAPSGYGEALRAVYPLALSVAPGFLLTVANTVITFEERTSISSWATAAGAILAVACEILLLGLGDHTLVAFGTPIAHLTALGVILLLSRRVRSVMPFGDTLFFGAVSITVSVLAFAQRQIMAARLILCVIPVLLLIRCLYGIKGLITE